MKPLSSTSVYWTLPILVWLGIQLIMVVLLSHAVSLVSGESRFVVSTVVIVSATTTTLLTVAAGALWTLMIFLGLHFFGVNLTLLDVAKAVALVFAGLATHSVAMLMWAVLDARAIGAYILGDPSTGGWVSYAAIGSFVVGIGLLVWDLRRRGCSLSDGIIASFGSAAILLGIWMVLGRLTSALLP